MKTEIKILLVLLIILFLFLGLFLNIDIRNNFLGNLFTDVIIGIIFSILLALWINGIITKIQNSENRIEERKRELSNSISYLQLIKIELDKLIIQIPEHMVANAISMKPVSPNVNVGTPLWNILQPSGELPKVMDPNLLSDMANCYACVNESRRWLKNYQEAISIGSIPPQQNDQIVMQICNRFQEVKELAEILSPRIPVEINRLTEWKEKL